MKTEDIKQLAARRLEEFVGATDVRVSREDDLLRIDFNDGPVAHKFWLHRSEEKVWFIAEHRANGAPQPSHVGMGNDSVLALITDAIARPSRSLVQPTLVELRCPVDSRRLFGKLIAPNPTPAGTHSMLEFSCPQCKRSSGRVTMHVFDAVTGDLLATNDVGTWQRRPTTTSWYKPAAVTV